MVERDPNKTPTGERAYGKGKLGTDTRLADKIKEEV
jgi:hypothetical protein